MGNAKQALCLGWLSSKPHGSNICNRQPSLACWQVFKKGGIYVIQLLEGLLETLRVNNAQQHAHP